MLYGWSAWLAWREPERLRTLWQARRRLLAGEALFLVVFAIVLLVRAQAPAAINTEKPMDLMLLSAVHEAERMPPADSWLAGYGVSYYHLGHVMIDVRRAARGDRAALRLQPRAGGGGRARGPSRSPGSRATRSCSARGGGAPRPGLRPASRSWR